MLQVPSDTDAPELCIADGPSVPSRSSCSQQQNPGHNFYHVHNSVIEEAADNIDLNLFYLYVTMLCSGHSYRKSVCHL